MSFIKHLTVYRLWIVLMTGTGCWSSSAEEETWKINLKNADLREFITQISAITSRNFVLDPSVEGRVTVISATPLTAAAAYELLLSVLRVNGFAAVPGENAVQIVQQNTAKQLGGSSALSPRAGAGGLPKGETLVTRVLPIRHRQATELVKSLRALAPTHSHMAALSGPNVLIISDHASNIDRMMAIIRHLDVPDTSETQLITLDHVWVNDLVTLLETLAPEHIGKGAAGPTRVRVVASERTNTLVIRGEKHLLVKMQELIQELDQPVARANTTEVIRLAHSDAAAMAELLREMTTGAQDEADSPLAATRIQADESLNALVIRAAPDVLAELRSIVAELDVRRVQVLIEAAIVEVTTNFDRQLGTELAVADRSGNGLPVAVTAPGGTLVQILRDLANNDVTTLPSGAAPIFGVGRTNPKGLNFALLIRALAENRDANLLSTPSILTLDNEEAKITVGRNVPFRTGSTVTGSSGATNPFTTIQRQDVGVTLQVTPQIQDNSLVKLLVHQEVSEVDQGNIGIGAEGASDLITQKRTIDTTVLADDGEVIILGGLIRDNATVKTTRVPVVSRIPLLGRLFRSDSRELEKRNLLVFLRPTILTSREETAEASKRKYNSVRELVIEGVSTEDALMQLLDGIAPRPQS